MSIDRFFPTEGDAKNTGLRYQVPDRELCLKQNQVVSDYDHAGMAYQSIATSSGLFSIKADFSPSPFPNFSELAQVTI